MNGHSSNQADSQQYSAAPTSQPHFAVRAPNPFPQFPPQQTQFPPQQYPPALYRVPSSAGSTAYFAGPMYSQPQHLFAPQAPNPYSPLFPPPAANYRFPPLSAPDASARPLAQTPPLSAPALAAAKRKEKPAALDYTPRVAGKWVEYRTENGRCYYYDSVSKTTRWERPAEFFPPSAAPGADPQHAAARPMGLRSFEVASEAPAPAAERRAPHAEMAAGDAAPQSEGAAPADSFNLLSDEERVEMFRSLLRERAVAFDAEWAGALSDIIVDPRYGAVRTLGERKKIFAEHCAELRDERRRARKAQVETQGAELYAALEGEPSLGADARFKDAEALLGADARFAGLKCAERREVFDRFRRALRDALKQKYQAAFGENAPLFEKLLQRDETVGFQDRWDDVRGRYAEESCFKALKESDRAALFKAHRARLEKTQRREDEKKRERQRRAEREFRRLLDDLAFKKTLVHSKSRWEEVKGLKELSEDKRYKAFAEMEERRELPRKMFESFCCALEDDFSKEKRSLKRFLRAKRLRVRETDTVPALYDGLAKDKKFPKMKSAGAKVLLLEMIAKAKHRKSKAAAKSKR